MYQSLLYNIKKVISTILFLCFFRIPAIAKKIIGKINLTSIDWNVKIWKENKVFPWSFHIKNGSEKITIWNYGAFWENITIIGENHDIWYPAIQAIFYKKHFNSYPWNTSKWPIKIGHDVWIWDNVTILSGVKIWNGSCIWAGSIVTKSVEPYAIVWWVPAKKIKMRYEKDIINFLNNLERWHWDSSKIKKNYDFFNTNISQLKIEEIKNLIK